MPRMTAQQIAEKQARNTAAATQDYVAGINAVTVSPGQQAAAKADQWATNTAAAKDKYRERVGAVDLGSWKRSATDKATRLAQGAQAAVPKTTQFWNEFGPHLDSGVSQVRSMPNASMEDRINRSVAMMRHNAKFKRS